MTTVLVTNNNIKTFAFEYGGKEMIFESKKSLEIPLDAACHIFGYKDNNKEKYLAPLGLCSTANEIADGLQKLEKFVITEKQPKQNHFLSPVVEPVPLTSEKKLGGTFLSRLR